MRNNKRNRRNEVCERDPSKPKIVKKNYHVTSQTAYHITELALSMDTSEGRIIDKLMRNYLAARGSY